MGKKEVLDTKVKLRKEEDIEFDEETCAFIHNQKKEFYFGKNSMAITKRGNTPGQR